jgi:hypothetical protein
VKRSRERYGVKDSFVVRPDRPVQTIEFATSIGDLPTYYSREGYDMPYGSIDTGEQIKILLTREAPENVNEIMHKLHKNAVIFDLQALQKESIKEG